MEPYSYARTLVAHLREAGLAGHADELESALTQPMDIIRRWEAVNAVVQTLVAERARFERGLRMRVLVVSNKLARSGPIDARRLHPEVVSVLEAHQESYTLIVPGSDEPAVTWMLANFELSSSGRLMLDGHPRSDCLPWSVPLEVAPAFEAICTRHVVDDPEVSVVWNSYPASVDLKLSVLRRYADKILAYQWFIDVFVICMSQEWCVQVWRGVFREVSFVARRA